MADVLVVYWSGTGNTEIMATKIKEGIEAEGVSVDLKSVSEISVDQAKNYSKICFGCPSMGSEELEEDEFEPFFSSIEADLASKKIALFGSYGWGDGEWMQEWEKRVDGTNLYKGHGLIINSTPGSDEEQTCIDFGKGFAKF